MKDVDVYVSVCSVQSVLDQVLVLTISYMILSVCLKLYIQQVLHLVMRSRETEQKSGSLIY
jgi:hypothetical protein